MKFKLSILFLLISAMAFAQDSPYIKPVIWTPMSSNYQFKQQVKIDSALQVKKLLAKDSSAFQGVVTAPTLSTGDSSNKLATTKFVKQIAASISGGPGFDYSAKLDSIRRLSDLTVVEYSGSPSAVVGNPIYRDSVGITALFRAVGTDSIYAVINGLPVFQYKDSTGGGGTTSDQTVVATGGEEDFDFTDVPASYDDIIIFRNGMELEPITHYTKSGNTITTIIPMAAGDRIRMKRIK